MPLTQLDTSPQVLIGTPGRVLDMIQKNYLYTDKLKTLVFDEADEILIIGFKETVHDDYKVYSEGNTNMSF